jgi:hypothetical protein
MKKFLTDAPLVKKMRDGEWDELAIFCLGQSVTGYYMAVKVTRSNGSTNTTYSGITIAGGRMTYVITCPSGEGYFVGGGVTYPLVKIETWLELVDHTRVTEIRTFMADTLCRKRPTRIGWLNTLGGIDYYTFTGTRSSESIIERTEYLKDLPASFTVTDRTSAVLGSSFREEFEVISDFETESVYRWLSKILISPEVWIVENNVVIPINISSKGNPIESDTFFQMKMKYHKSSDIISQNG